MKEQSGTFFLVVGAQPELGLHPVVSLLYRSSRASGNPAAVPPREGGLVVLPIAATTDERHYTFNGFCK